ncbi:hypothetical protein ElyMa_002526500 [Elysia marginata]|uniref:Uncharacterized protein n=1 Tax=Elysia marginata TaxID=1093978 RepID=A0AAV4GU01_9GAST|nr:hypothetical protein ElyMa_002526500 [Elysia marginata]
MPQRTTFRFFSLRKKRSNQELHPAEKIQPPNVRESTSSSTEINSTPETAANVTGMPHAAVMVPTRVSDKPLLVPIPDSLSVTPPSAQETKSPLPSSSTVPIEPGPSSVSSDISSEHVNQGAKKTRRKRPCQPSKWKQNEKKGLETLVMHTLVSKASKYQQKQ